MKRKFWEKLENWKNSKNKKPLLVVGARQVGKSYIIDKFCKENYKNYYCINLFEDERLVEWFKNLKTFDEKLEILELTYNINLKDENTIVFIDEVQESEEFIESLKIFCERGYTNIICAGSLLGVKLSRMSCSFPVGKVYLEYLYPMDFEEYLMAIGKERYIEVIKKSFRENKECLLHEELMSDFKKFLFLGGMPEVVQNFIENNCKILGMDTKILKGIIDSYIIDMKKHTKDEKENIRIERIYKNIPSQLCKENQKFAFVKIDQKDNRKRDYITALDWLVSSMLVLPCYLVTSPEHPLLSYIDDDSYKLFLNDTGILSFLSGVDASQILDNTDIPFKGVLVENYVACELIKLNFNLSYWSRKNNTNGNAEVDFVIDVKGMVIPIEVKAGVDMKSKSLSVFNEKYNPNLLVKISAKNFGYNEETKIKTIPLYATFCLPLLRDDIN